MTEVTEMTEMFSTLLTWDRDMPGRAAFILGYSSPTLSTCHHHIIIIIIIVIILII